MFRGRFDGTPELLAKTVHIQEEHVERAASVLKVLHMLKAVAVHTKSEDSPSVDADAEEAKRQDMLSFIGVASAPFDGVWSQHAFAPVSEVAGSVLAAASPQAEVPEV